MSISAQSSTRQRTRYLFWSSHRRQNGGCLRTWTKWTDIFLTCALLFAVVEGCAVEEKCLGGRPHTPLGCCPVEGGDDCGTEVGVECDEGLGFTCRDQQSNVNTTRGVCTGKYDLQATDVQARTVTLQWRDFKAADYLYEYVLLYRPESYSTDQSGWEILDIGTQPHYTVSKLQPGTLYFMRVGVWVDPDSSVVGNASEVIWVNTASVSVCTYAGEEFAVGQVLENCEDSCTCLATGQMHCTPLCSESQLPAVREGCTLQYAEECSCEATEYCPNEHDVGCEFEGQEYDSESSVTSGCRTCYCRRGAMSCHYPERCQILEASEACPHPVASSQPGEDCCPVWSCQEYTSTTPATPTSGCHYKQNVYPDGAFWADNDECVSCTCEAGHVACHVTCPEPVEPEDCENAVRRTQDNGCCEIFVCETAGPVEGEEECDYNGTVYRLGDTFNSACSLCMCVHGNTVNCSLSSCPAIQLPMPTILCPFPSVQRDGCCDTVVCGGEDVDLQTLMRRLMAISYNPNSLTVSFDVDHTTSAEGSVTQDRYEVMTSDRGGDAGSWTSKTFSPTAVDTDDNASSPTDLLHNDAAIQVDERVYITLGGLNPNTTYYVRVRPVLKRDMGVTETTPVNVTLVSSIVATTMKEDYACKVGDKAYQDGDTISETCEEVCKCKVGHVICDSACAGEHVILAPSPSCPQPKLVPSQGSCCKTWKCFPEEKGCVHKEMFLKNGEQVYEGSCDLKCKCTDGEVTCTSVCLPAPPSPRATCVLTNVTGTCCPLWMCPQEMKPPVEASLAFQVRYQGVCADSESFKSSVKKTFMDGLLKHLHCAEKNSVYFVTCWVKDVAVTCPLLDSFRRRQQTSEIEIIAVLAVNMTESSSLERILNSLNATEQALSAMFKRRDTWPLTIGEGNLTSSGLFHSFGISVSCGEGLIFQNNACVPENLYPPRTANESYNVSMTVVNNSHDSATFAWSRLSPNSLNYVIGLVIQYRKMTSDHWNHTMTLHPSTTRHTLTYLHASSLYKVRLLALTKWASQPHMPLSMIFFTTKNREVLTRSLTMDPLRVSLGLTSVTITWSPLHKDVIDVITKLWVTYRKSQDTGNVSSSDIDPRQSDVKLQGLTSGTAYVTKFVIILANGSTITTRPLHFVTMAEADSSERLIIPMLAVCSIIVVLFTVLAFFFWRRMRKMSSLDTAFENKTYGVNITSLCSTRAKNESARPQDLEASGSSSSSAASDTSSVSDLRLQA